MLLRRRVEQGIDISSAAFAAASTIEVSDSPYTGQPIKPTVVITYNNTVLTEGVDYVLRYSDGSQWPTKMGRHLFRIIGCGRYYNQVYQYYQISQPVLSPSDVVFNNGQPFYYNDGYLTGNHQNALSKVVIGQNVGSYYYMVNGQQVSSLTEAGTYTVTLVSENYQDYIFQITINQTVIDSSLYHLAYLGNAITYNASPVSNPILALLDSNDNVVDNDVTAFAGQSVVTYTWTDGEGSVLSGAPTNAGSYRVGVAFSGNYVLQGMYAPITIHEYPVKIVWSGTFVQYNGQEHMPRATILYSTPDHIFVVVTGPTATDVGSYLFTALLDGDAVSNYVITSGETATLTISKLQITVPTNQTYTYEGVDRKPQNTEYVIYTSQAVEMIDAGTYAVTASLLDTQNTEWSDGTTVDKTLTLTIDAADIINCTVTGIDASYAYTGSDITPSPTVTFGGDTLVKNTDYTVSYSDNISVGTAYVTITGIGNFTGTTTVTFEIIGVSQLDFSGLSSLTPGFVQISNNSYTILSEQPSYSYGNVYVVRLVPSASMTVADFVAMFPASQQPNIVMRNAKRGVISTSAYGSTTLTTGMSIQLINNNTIYDDFYIALSGDLNGDGVANSIDNNLLKRYLRGQALSELQLVAADRNWDGTVNVADVSTWTNWG